METSVDPARLLEVAALRTPDEWFELLLKSATSAVEVDGVALPRFPSDELQSLFVGSSGEHALWEARVFHRILLETCDANGVDLGASSRVLDFGAGWGRFMRFFYQIVPWDRLWGLDPWHLAVQTCRSTGVYGQFVKTDLLPPTMLCSESFDLAFAYSVFSHLSPQAGVEWIKELARLVKPGGLAILTTQGRSFIEYCAGLNQDSIESEWQKALARSFPDPEQVLRDYDSGRMVYAPNGGGEALPGSIYGDAIVPRLHIEEHWTEDFELVSFVDDRAVLAQAYVVLRRK